MKNQIYVKRKTKETDILLQLQVVGSQKLSIETGIGFFDHMLQQLAFHSGWDLQIKVYGDLQIDDHHVVEDTAICLGDAINQYWRSVDSICRYGQSLLPMDETLVLVAVDVSGRGLYRGELNFNREFLGTLSTEMIAHFFKTFAMKAGLTLHIKPMDFENNHHLAEACFKATARALKQALNTNNMESSTKGLL